MVEEFNLEKSDYRNRLMYSGSPIGNYRKVTDNVIKIGFLFAGATLFRKSAGKTSVASYYFGFFSAVFADFCSVFNNFSAKTASVGIY